MSLLKQVTFGLTVLAGIGVYAGLDKLINIFLLLALLSLTHIFNKLNAAIENQSLPRLPLPGRFSERIGSDRARHILRIAVNFSASGACVFIFYELYKLSLGLNLSVYESLNRQGLYLTVSVGLVFFGIFALRTLQETKDSAAAVQWYRATCYFAIFHVALFVLSLISSLLSEAEAQIFIQLVDFGFFAGFFALALLVAEFAVGFVRNLSALSRGKSIATSLPVPFFIRFFAAEESFKRSLVKSVEMISGVDVSRSEIVGFFVKIFEPVCIFAVVLVWLLSSLVIVAPDQEAIFARFGRICENKAFGPGLYIKLPWPFSTAQLFESYKIRTINVGFEPDPNQRHIIWTKAHAVKYFDLIVGDGLEIIAIDCQIMFRINNLYKYITGLQNPEEFISASTYKLLTQETVSARFDDIITRDRKILADLVKTKLQAAADEKDLGVSIVEVVFLAMHPPLEVADAFEDVISAQIDKLTYELKANSENSYKISMSKALARDKELEAESYAANLVAVATGEAGSFASRTLGYEFDPELTSFRLRYERMQQVLTGKTLYIIDKSLLRKEDKLFIDANGQER